MIFKHILVCSLRFAFKRSRNIKMYNMTSWQKVIFRNYGVVKTSLIAKILNISEEEVCLNAEKLGLSRLQYNPLWKEKGFVTIIRNNWDILSLDNIALILEISRQELDKLLVEYDFLDVKLGEQPNIEDCSYFPLSIKQEIITENIRKIVEENFPEKNQSLFNFYDNYVKPCFVSKNNGRVADRFTSSYSSRYTGALLDGQLLDYGEDYLQKLADNGVNGIWVHDTLRNLAEFPFDTNYSAGYEIRIKNLKKLTERCEKFGIKVYLYLNEPRSLPASFFLKHPDLKGQKVDDENFCLCTSKKLVKEYLYNAIRCIAENVPKLFAVMSITMAENPTHCYSCYWDNNPIMHTDCVDCKKREPQEMVAEINNIIYNALRDGNGYTRLIAYVWAWNYLSVPDRRDSSDYKKFNMSNIYKTIDLMDKNIDILCVSEYFKEFEREKVVTSVADYSISVLGPSEFAENVLNYAKNNGHRVWAKIQVNNSWECSAVPYLPTFGLMIEHVKRVKRLGVSGLMLGWSLGGYPGGALSLVNSLCVDDSFDDGVWYQTMYEENADVIKKSVAIFDAAFLNYPYYRSLLYLGAHNMGPGNLWSLKKQNRKSTMVCFSFDDVERWTFPYGVDKYIILMQKLCDEWNMGLKILENLSGNEATREFIRNANVALYILEVH